MNKCMVFSMRSEIYRFTELKGVYNCKVCMLKNSSLQIANSLVSHDIYYRAYETPNLGRSNIWSILLVCASLFTKAAWPEKQQNSPRL